MARFLSAGLSALSRWAEMIKLAHSVFALPFALIATFLAARSAYWAGRAAHSYPTPVQLLLIVGCMVGARSVAMTFNRVVDAELDARNPRTAGRAIPAGIITRGLAAVFLGGALGLFIACCAGFWLIEHNPIPLALAGPVIAYLCFYSYTKRFTRWSHFVLGSAIALAPPAAWAAIDPASLGWPAILLMLIVTLWIGGFDIIYACQDIDFDRAHGLFSLPARLGPRAALTIARVAHAATVALLVIMVPVARLGRLYGFGAAITAGLLLVENALVRPDDFSRVNVAFFTVNGAISLLLAALTIADVLMNPLR